MPPQSPFRYRKIFIFIPHPVAVCTGLRCYHCEHRADKPHQHNIILIFLFFFVTSTIPILLRTFPSRREGVSEPETIIIWEDSFLHMGRINLYDLKPGMVLGDDLYAPNDRFLLPQGTVLEEKHFKIFKIWGVSEAVIQDLSEETAEVETYEGIGDDIIEKSTDTVNRVFRHANTTHEAVAELYRLSQLRLARSLSNGLGDQDLWLSDVDHSTAASGTSPPPDDKPTLPDIIKEDFQFLSLPDTYYKVSEAINNPQSSASYIARIVSADVGLSAKLIKLVNSSFYGLPQKVDTLSRAVSILGSKQLSTLVMGVSVTALFKNIPADLIDIQSFWRHSICCGVVSRLMASMHKNVNEEPFFVAGLLHDIGRLVLLENYSQLARSIMDTSQHRESLLHETEKESLGFDHAGIGGLLFQQWKLPPSLENCVAYHHEPGKAGSAFEPSIVHLADIIAHTMFMGNSGNLFVPPLDPLAWNELGFSKSVLATIIVQADHQVDELFSILF